MQALILAAGNGNRINDHLGRPKCLRGGGDIPLLHHQRAALASIDILVLGVSVVLLAMDAWLGLAYLAGLGVAIGVALIGSDRAAAMARLAEPRATTAEAR